jgi:hypothetical protein
MAGSFLSQRNLASILKVVALLLFFVPWVTLSCGEQTLVSMSGYNLATGTAAFHNPMTGAIETPPGGAQSDIWVILGGALIAASLLIGLLLRNRQGAMLAIAATLGGAAALAYTILVRLPARAHETPTGQAASGMNSQRLAEMIRVNVQIGFWLLLAALVAAAILEWLEASRAAAPPAAAPT